MSHTPSPSPLPAVLPFVFVNSLGTGAVTLGIFFLAQSRFDLEPKSTFLLGALIGLTYIPGALAIGPALSRMTARYPALNPRIVLAATTAALGLICFLPALAVGDPGDDSGQWALWVFVMLYAPLSGVLWPITESYVSGGRTGRELRRAVGRFNIVWSTAVVVSFWAMAPLVQSRPLHVLTLLGFIHLAAVGLLIPMGREPGRHIRAQRQPHPPVYTRLLTVFRFQLPASYIVISALAPFLPFALIRLEVDIRHALPIASAWTVSRLATFVLMERWHGWHGRWWLFFVTALLMLAGFALCLIASAIGGRQSLPLLIAGLAACGIGIGGIYTAAFYYVMEVGDATVSAGGSHEALIGLGYTVGPTLGMLAIFMAQNRPASESPTFEPIMLALVSATVLALAAIAFALACRHARRSSNHTNT